MGAAEGFVGDVGLEDEFKLTTEVVFAALMDGEGRGCVRSGAAQRHGGLMWVVRIDGLVGPIQELVGFSQVVGGGSHVGWRLLGLGRGGLQARRYSAEC